MNDVPTDDLSDFVESICGDSAFRIDENLGNGYVRLGISEAEKRQAAQDIQSSEDILLEMLRNSRDAGSKRIFIALNKDAEKRTIVVIDDGDGIPTEMFEKIFEPRVTSKLDTAHMDKWGMHGRGMALYSISLHSLTHNVVESRNDLGTSMKIVTDTDELAEKTDQSTFPHFEKVDDTFAMRGPKNLIRVASEFALEHRNEIDVYCGSFTDITACLYQYGLSALSPSKRAFKANMDITPIFMWPAFAVDADDFASIASSIGLDISSRSARRIMDGEIKPVPTLVERLSNESFPKEKRRTKRRVDRFSDTADFAKLHLDAEDIKIIEEIGRSALDQLADKYYLDPSVGLEVEVKNGFLNISFPLIEKP